jgi:Holliday junction DNA helicase RuvA
MIGQLNGILLEKNPPQVLVDCAGVGYEVDVPMSTFYQLPACGERVKLLIHFVVREDAQILYGFATLSEKNAFKQLVRISGVGPRTALGVLSGMSVQELAQAVSLQEGGRLTKIPGIGKKTAERLLLELKGKLSLDLGGLGGLGGLDEAGGGAAVGHVQSESSAQNDILSALMTLGYSERDALLALKSLPPGTGVAEGIKAALRAMSK